MCFCFYCPQRSCGKIMFSQASIILFTGGCGRHPPEQTPRGQKPSWADTPWAETTLGRYPTWTDTPSRVDNPPPKMATAAHGTHPTGMHSCCLFYFSLLPSKCQCNIQVVQMSNLAHIYQGCSLKELTFSYLLKYKSHIHYSNKYLLVRFW